MNMPATQPDGWDDFFAPIEAPFTEKNNYKMNFESECYFAKQVLMANNGAMNAAQKNPVSLQNAIENIAAVGITLNPVKKFAYLVPREGKICLDVSYLGLLKLAGDSGAIVTAKAMLVHGPRGNYPGDNYVSNGPFMAPKHEYESFHPERVNGDDPIENIIGGYCMAILPSGTVIVEEMTAAEIFAVRATSKAYSSGKACPWKGKWSGQMAKKTLIKRGANSWPQSDQRDRLDTAISILNEHEGLRDINTPAPAETAAPLCISQDQTADLLKAIEVAGITAKAFCHMAGVETVSALDSGRLDGAKARLQQIAQRGAQQ